MVALKITWNNDTSKLPWKGDFAWPSNKSFISWERLDMATWSKLVRFTVRQKIINCCIKSQRMSMCRLQCRAVHSSVSMQLRKNRRCEHSSIFSGLWISCNLQRRERYGRFSSKKSLHFALKLILNIEKFKRLGISRKTGPKSCSLINHTVECQKLFVRSIRTSILFPRKWRNNSLNILSTHWWWICDIISDFISEYYILIKNLHCLSKTYEKTKFMSFRIAPSEVKVIVFVLKNYFISRTTKVWRCFAKSTTADGSWVDYTAG